MTHVSFVNNTAYETNEIDFVRGGAVFADDCVFECNSCDFTGNKVIATVRALQRRPRCQEQY